MKSVYLNMCHGDLDSFQEDHDMSMDEAIERGMGSKINDMEELINAYFTEDISLEYQLADKEIISQMWKGITPFIRMFR